MHLRSPLCTKGARPAVGPEHGQDAHARLHVFTDYETSRPPHSRCPGRLLIILTGMKNDNMGTVGVGWFMTGSSPLLEALR